MTSLRARRRRTSGQALAEFALIVPLLVLVIFGIIDFGRYVYTQNALNQASREGARSGSVRNRPAECTGQDRLVCAQTIALGRLTGIIGPVTTNVTCEEVTQLDADSDGELDRQPVTALNCETNNLLKVRATNTFTLFTPLVGQFFGSVDLYGEAQVAVNS